MAVLRKIARRTFLIGSAAVAGGVVFGVYKYKKPYANPLLAKVSDGDSAITPYVMINSEGVTIITPRAEMGQGVHTTLAALVAEELDLTLEQVTVDHGPASSAYFNSAGFEEGVPFASTDKSWKAEQARAFSRVPAKFLGMQFTGGSSTVPDAFVKMREAGAVARRVLLEAAAQKLQVDVSRLKTDQGEVVTDDGQRLSYAELATIASTIEVPDQVELKPPSQWKILGKSQERVDIVSKSTGTAEYAIDVQLPGMVFASVKTNPHLGAGMNSFDASRAERMRGVKKVIALENGAAVIASNTWYAFQAVNAIRFDWRDADYPLTTDGTFDALEAAFDENYQDSRNRDDGDVEQALSGSATIAREYKAPYLAHATMEPMNATAWLHDGRLEVWAGTQTPTKVLDDAEAITLLPPEKIEIHTTFMGGGFGRRAETDFIKQAIYLAKAMKGTPVKLTWTREEDMTHDFYRPAALARFRGVVEKGVPIALDLDISSVSVLESQLGRSDLPVVGSDVTLVQAAWDQPYAIEHYRVTGYRAPALLPVGSWRSVGGSQNGFFHESAIDELAAEAGVDPMTMRLNLMSDEVSAKVLKAAASMSQWGRELPAGHALGVAFVTSFGVPVAEVIEVVKTTAGIKILNVWAAVDVGQALDPRNVEAQVISGINFGLAAAMTGEITLKNGAIEQSNFHNYPSIRFNQAPAIHVTILENQESVRGIGEPGTPPAAPALANAIFAATGQRIRELPLAKHIKFA